MSCIKYIMKQVDGEMELYKIMSNFLRAESITELLLGNEDKHIAYKQALNALERYHRNIQDEMYNNER